MAQNRRRRERNLIKFINSLERQLFAKLDLNTNSLLKEAQNETLQLYNFKLKGIQIRSRARWVEDGEKNGKYFLNLEKRHKTQNTVDFTTKTNGSLITSNEGILNEFYQFYSNLFSSTSTDLNLSNFFGDVTFNRTLTDDEADSCNGILTVDECRVALESMAANKSPGSDDLTSEFYKFF